MVWGRELAGREEGGRAGRRSGGGDGGGVVWRGARGCRQCVAGGRQPGSRTRGGELGPKPEIDWW